MAVHLIQFLCLISALFPSLFFALSETTCSAPLHNDRLICELYPLKHKISQLESVLEESTKNLNQKSLYLKEREEAIESMSRKIHHLQSPIDGLKGESSRADERLSALEDEVRHLWATSRKNNFDIHNLEYKAQDAEDRLERVTSQVENMADIVTEHWIQIQRLEQALQITKMRARRQVGSTRCTFLKFSNNLFGNHFQKLFGVLDPYLFGKGPTLSSYISQALHKLKRVFIEAKKYHHQLQGLIKQEMEKNEFTAALAHSELVFILASALITFPLMGAWVLLSSQFSKQPGTAPNRSLSELHHSHSQREREREMAGLLAWAADVVGAGGAQSNGEDDPNSIPIVFAAEQQKYVQELDQKAASLSRAIQDLRLRLPPPDISQRLPHLHAHSLASNAALALQLNSHSATREQAQLREVTLQEENAAYEKAISNCENKIKEKMQEAVLLQRKLEELNETTKNLRAELESREAALVASQSGRFSDSVVKSKLVVEGGPDSEESNSAILEKLENKKKELSSTEGVVQDLEKRWAQVQDKALKQPTPAQREKILDKQLHSLIEQLEAKQAQAESLFSDIHIKEMELERLNGLWRRVESINLEVNAARNRFGRSASERGSASSDYIVDVHLKPPYYPGGRSENQQKLMLLRSTFVLYIFALHILVFIKISL